MRFSSPCHYNKQLHQIVTLMFLSFNHLARRISHLGSVLVTLQNVSGAAFSGIRQWSRKSSWSSSQIGIIGDYPLRSCIPRPLHFCLRKLIRSHNHNIVGLVCIVRNRVSVHCISNRKVEHSKIKDFVAYPGVSDELPQIFSTFDTRTQYAPGQSLEHSALGFKASMISLSFFLWW